MYIQKNSFKRQHNNFDLLRLVAALLVLFSHMCGIHKINIEPLYLLTGGKYYLSSWGLIIFFITSGYLICRSVHHSTLKDYFLNRFLRISPALFVCSLLTILIPGIIFTTLPLGTFLAHPRTWYFLLQNTVPVRVVMSLPGVFNGSAINPSLWTIPLEIKLYVLLALCFLSGLLKRRLLFAISWLLLIAVYVFFFHEIKQALPVKNLHNTLQYGIYFLGGAIFYLYRDKIPVLFLVWLLLLVVWMIALLLAPSLLFITSIPFFIYTVIGIGTSSFRVPFPDIDISYGVYIYGFPVQASIEYGIGEKLGFLQFSMIVLAITTLFATASWLLVEKKALSLKKHYRFSKSILAR